MLKKICIVTFEKKYLKTKKKERKIEHQHHALLALWQILFKCQPRDYRLYLIWKRHIIKFKLLGINYIVRNIGVVGEWKVTNWLIIRL